MADPRPRRGLENEEKGVPGTWKPVIRSSLLPVDQVLAPIFGLYQVVAPAAGRENTASISRRTL